MVVGFGNSPLKNGRKDQPSSKDQLVREGWRFLFFCMQNQVSKFLNFRVLIDLGKMKMLETDVYTIIPFPVYISYWHHLHIHACFDIFLPSYIPSTCISYCIPSSTLTYHLTQGLPWKHLIYHHLYINIYQTWAPSWCWNIPPTPNAIQIASPHEIPCPLWSFPCLKAIMVAV